MSNTLLNEPTLLNQDPHGNGTFVPVLASTGSFVYTNGLVTQEPNGKTYTYNGDGTVHTESFGGTTRTYTYNVDGSLASVA